MPLGRADQRNPLEGVDHQQSHHGGRQHLAQPGDHLGRLLAVREDHKGANRVIIQPSATASTVINVCEAVSVISVSSRSAVR